MDREKGVSTHAYRVWDQPVQVTAPLAEALECTVLLENNVKAFAQAELIYGLGRTEENLLLLKWGPGVGSAIIAQGRIYESRMYKSAEIGHVRVEKNGRLCRCGRHGCLETRVASHPIARHLRQVCNPETTPLLWAAVGGRPENITVHNLDTLAALDEPAMWEALDADIEVLADVVGSCLTMLTPDHLILYGYMFKLPHFREKFLAACKRYDPAYDENYIRVSELAEKLEYIGAAGGCDQRAVLSGLKILSGKQAKSVLWSKRAQGLCKVLGGACPTAFIFTRKGEFPHVIHHGTGCRNHFQPLHPVQ